MSRVDQIQLGPKLKLAEEHCQLFASDKRYDCKLKINVMFSSIEITWILITTFCIVFLFYIMYLSLPHVLERKG